MESYIYYTTDHKYRDQNFLPYISIHCSSPKASNPFLSQVLRCLDENLIKIPFPIMGSPYIPSFLSFVTNFFGKRKANKASVAT